MGDIVLAGSTSGTTTLTPTAVSGTTTLTLPATTGTVALTAAPTFTGQATIPTINLTGGQITFPATQSASADANTLDDYEEGTFTPTLSTSGTAPVLTYTEQAGIYIKIGKMVYISFRISINVLTSGGSGILNITGLPFTSGTGTGAFYNALAIGYQASWGGSQAPTAAMVFPASTSIRPYYQTAISANRSDMDYAALATGVDSYISGCYYASA